MKALVTCLVVTGTTAGILLGQGLNFSGPGKPYDPKVAPALPLSKAYTLALAKIGPATNRFYCVSASCLEKTLPEYGGWVFWFSNTNNDRARVEVYFPDGSADIPDAKSDELLRSK